MTIGWHHCRCRWWFVVLLIVCLMLPSPVMSARGKENLHAGTEENPFLVLILGDSQMAGMGWEGGYANCIRETYPDAQVVNLAQNGSLLANGDIYAQWEFYLSQGLPLPDFVLLDGGINDLPHLQKEEFQDTGFVWVEKALRTLIEEVHEAGPDIRIIYTIMPPLEEWNDSSFGPPAYDIQKSYWKQMNIIANAYDYVTVLDQFSLNPFHYPCAECYQENLADSVHLSEAGYRNTFEYINNILVAGLAEKLSD